MTFNEDTLNQAPAEQSNNIMSPADALAGPFEAAQAVNDEAQPQAAPGGEHLPEGIPGGSLDATKQDAGTPQDNDKVRYEYWQSQATKAQNELKQVQDVLPYVQYAQQHPEALQALQNHAQGQAQPGAQMQEEEFPAAPERPNKPRGFNREEAYTDPSCDSARYLDEVEEWQSNTEEYNRLYAEYNNAKMQETINMMQQQQLKAQQQRQLAIQRNNAFKEAEKHVVANYGLTPEEATQFVQQYSNDSSVTMENLVALWRMHNPGIGTQTVNTAVAQPSETFKQMQNAQQVPSPMGVMPASNNSMRTPADTIMDELVSDFKGKNPW